MTSNLPEDCIYDILKYLQPHPSYLLKCTLINRFWCRVTIPFLYANPFNNTQNENVIPTLILCFSKPEILQLENQLVLIGVNNIIDIKDEYKPLFEYPKYIKFYNYQTVYDTIERWFIYSLYINYKKINIIRENFNSMFQQSFLYHSINIERISINFIYLNRFNPNFNLPISNLTKVNSLTLESLHSHDQRIGKEILSNIAIHYLNLKVLKFLSEPIINPKIVNILCKIIQKQNNLEEFKIERFPWIVYF
jgi:hypothetical protein